MQKASIFCALVCASWAAAAASADFYLKIDGVARAGADGPIYLKTRSIGDLDGDGVPDESIVRITCDGAKLVDAHYSVKSPRDLATGQASGKRTHGPVTFVKEWGPSTPQLGALKVGYDIKEAKTATMSADANEWSPIILTDTGGLCSAAAAGTVNKSKSNVRNN
ncbi:MAG: hypothetical protein ABIO43_10505 [Sphingomicrobium sp.]